MVLSLGVMNDSDEKVLEKDSSGGMSLTFIPKYLNEVDLEFCI